METNTRQDKIEAIIEICKYDRKLIGALKAVDECFEQGETIPSSWWGNVMQGVNWTIEVLNRTMDVLEEKGLDKQKINEALVAFNEAFSTGDTGKLAEVSEKSLIPCFEYICTMGEQISGDC